MRLWMSEGNARARHIGPDRTVQRILGRAIRGETAEMGLRRPIVTSVCHMQCLTLITNESAIVGGLTRHALPKSTPIFHPINAI
jgi:hypothetical protein